MPKTFIAKGAGGHSGFCFRPPSVSLVKCGEMPYYVMEILVIIARVIVAGRRGTIQMANGLSFSLLGFVIRGISDRRPCLLTMCLGLVLFQGCALLQSSVGYSHADRNSGTTCRSQDLKRCPTCARSSRRRLKKVPLGQRNCRKPGKLRGMERNIKGSRRPVEQFMIKRGLQPHIQAYHSVARSRLLISPTENRWK